MTLKPKPRSFQLQFDANGEKQGEFNSLLIIPDEFWDETLDDPKYLVRIAEDLLITAIRSMAQPGENLIGYIWESSERMKAYVRKSNNDTIKVIPASMLEERNETLN